MKRNLQTNSGKEVMYKIEWGRCETSVFRAAVKNALNKAHKQSPNTDDKPLP